MSTPDKKAAPRRRFLQRAATGAVATGALAAPMVSRAQTTSLRFQSTWGQPRTSSTSTPAISRRR